MRIMEIANAEEQLALLRLIMDKTWDAVAVQADQERRAKAARKAKAKRKPSSRKAVKAPYASPPPPLKKPLPLTANKPTLAEPSAGDAVKPMSSLHPGHAPVTQQDALAAPNTGYLDKNIDAEQNDERGDDGHSENAIARHKKPAATF